MRRPGHRTGYRIALLALSLLVLSSYLAFAPRESRSLARSSAKAASNGAVSKTPKLTELTPHSPLAFEANTGQVKAPIKFLVRGRGSALLLTPGAATLRSARSEITLKYANANPGVKISGSEQLTEVRNYLLGNDQSHWHTDVPTFGKVVYEQIYPGINLVFHGNQLELEYDFEIAPGADPRAIRLTLDRKSNAKLSAGGDLILSNKDTRLTHRKPVIYQEIDGRKQIVEGGFVVRKKHEIGFYVGPYDRARRLVIDPTIVYSTYLGGSGDDAASSIALDAAGDVYVAGTTASTNFPLQGPAFASNKGLADIFVTKINAAGAVAYSTYIGGSGLDRADAITIDNSGNAYVVGRVGDTSHDFPTTGGSLASTYRGGDFDGVVFKLNPQGNALVYSTFLGGEDNDSVEGITVDAAGNAYLTGGTRSNGFPLTASGFQSFRAGDTDAFFTKLNAAGSAVLYSTLLGGGSTDRGSGVALGAAGIVYIAGYSASPDFPTQNGFQVFSGGSFDAFIAKIDTNQSGATSLEFSTYLGGIADDKAFGVAFDQPTNSVYVVGQTSSNNFPVLNPFQPSSGGSFDAFVAKLSDSGNKIYATYIGGGGDDRGLGVTANATGVYVTGFTSSTNFPTVAPLQINNGGGFDAFVTKLNPAGTAILYSTYLGGAANENFVAAVTASNPIAVDASNAYVCGYTASTNFPSVAAAQGTNAGGQDAFVAKIADATPSADFSISVTPASRTINPADATTYTVTATPIGGFTGNISLSLNGLSGDAGGNFNPASIAINDATAKSSTLTVTTTVNTPPGTYPLLVTATSGNLQHSGSTQLVVSGPTTANLSITKTASPNPGITLANLTYRLTVTNKGPSPATSVVATDNLPAGVNFVSTTPTQGTCSGTSTVTCNLGSLPGNGTAIISIIVAPQSSGILSNSASVVAAESDPDPSDNSVNLQTTVNQPSSGPSMTDPNLSVKTVVTGLSQPTSMAFIGNNDFFIFEKNTGKVQRVVNGALQPPVLDLAVNSASERGGLGIALHPAFAFNGYVYLYWTESSTGTDSTNIAEVPVLGNRVDRYRWDGLKLVFDRNLIKLRAFQADANQQLRGNHNGGVLRFGPDGKLYILMGDNGRRGFLQNNLLGPVPDDQFGGPEPDNNHLTGFILRLNDDGSTPTDNPFSQIDTPLSFPTEAQANVRKLFAYGVRNGFGLGFDPYSGNLWDQENGDDAFDEMNRITAGSNNGWIQMMGPISRVAQYKQIESTYGSGDLQQLRWPPSLIANTPAAALAALYMLPGAHYNDPEFSWKYAVPASPLGFVKGRGLGPQFEGDMFVGAARTFLAGGFLFRMPLTSDRLHFAFTDSRLNDLVADNDDKFDIKESESLLIGRDFGITSDIHTGPNGNLFVVSNSNGAVYEISGRQPTVFVATLNGAQETPANNSPGSGTATLLLSPDETTARVSLNFSGLTSAQSDAHIHGPAAAGVIGPILFPLPNGNLSDFLITLTPTDVANLKNGLLYVNVHTSNFPNGEIRGQFGTSATANSVQFSAATYMESEAAGRVAITVTRLGDTTTAASANYATAEAAGSAPCAIIAGSASLRCDYQPAFGTVSFSPGETSKVILVSLVDDGRTEGNESLTISLSNATGSFLGSPSQATIVITDSETTPVVNPILATDDTGIGFFVRQHYRDFLGREPEVSEPWSAILKNCPDQMNVNPTSPSAACDRIAVSGAFFGSPEFLTKGVYTIDFYRVAFNRLPDFSEFVVDLASVSGLTPAETNAKRAAFANNFVLRPEFTSLYGAMSNTTYVNTLMGRYGLTSITTPDPANPDGPNKVTLTTTDLINRLNAGTLTRPQVLRAIVQSDQVVNAEAVNAFVASQYYGYLRRTPEPAGYASWVNYLNTHPGDFRTMINGFLNSSEYRLRFGNP